MKKEDPAEIFEILETDVRLSESCLWEALRNFYLEQGINAWNGQVPFFITSNVFFAQESARVLVSYCLDLFLKNKLDKNYPIYILELGAGTGQFSFYCLQELSRLWLEFNLENKIKFVYLITDLSPENIQFCETHEGFKKYKEAGVLQFINLDVSLVTELENLSQFNFKNPLITIANYLFDSLSQDAFSVRDKELFESLMSVSVPKESIQKGVLKTLEKIDTDFRSYLINADNYYLDPSFNFLLKLYQNKLEDGCFWLPIGALNLLNYLLKISSGNLLLLSTDKGFSSLEDFEEEEAPSLVVHGSFSFGVNFHAMGEWAKLLGADLAPIPMGEGIKSAVILWGDKLNDLPYFNQVVRKQAEEFNLADYFNFYQSFKNLKNPKNAKNISLEILLSIMRWSRWDPYIFSQFSKNLIIKMSETTANLITGFIENIDLLLSHIYPLPYGPDLYLPIAVMLHTLHFYERAIEIYKLSEAWGGAKFINLFNRGLCYSQIGDDVSAQIEFQNAEKFANTEELLRLKKWLN